MPGVGCEQRTETAGGRVADDNVELADVLVVNKEKVVEYRAVEIGALIDQMRVIEKGLQPTDWVVVKGLLRARPGSTVKPKRQEMLSRLSGSSTPSQ